MPSGLRDFETLANPSMIGMLYFVLFMILFLENGLLPPLFTRDSFAGIGGRAVCQRGDGVSADHFLTDRRRKSRLLGRAYI